MNRFSAAIPKFFALRPRFLPVAGVRRTVPFFRSDFGHFFIISPTVFSRFPPENQDFLRNQLFSVPKHCIFQRFLHLFRTFPFLFAKSVVILMFFTTNCHRSVVILMFFIENPHRSVVVFQHRVLLPDGPPGHIRYMFGTNPS